MSGYSEDDLAGLTDEERAALLEDDGGGETNANGNDDDTGNGDDDANNGGDDGKGAENGAGAEGDAGKTQGQNDDDDATGKAAAGDKGAGGDGGADDGDDGAAAATTGTSAEQPIVPLLVAEAPADADAKLKEISDKKATLLDQFDNGDITAKEYQSQLDTLGKQEREIERAVDKAKMANEMRQQQEMNAWLGQVKDFTTKDYPEYSKSRSRWMALDTFVKEIAAKPENSNLDGREILRQAHARVVEDLGEAPAAATGNKGGKQEANKEGKPLKGAKIDPPKTLAKVPASDNADIDTGRFAALDRLADTDPLALEEKLMKMSADDRDAYLAARG